VTVRTFYNAGDPDDLAKAHAAQDQNRDQRRRPGPFEAPNWDTINSRSRARPSATWGNWALIPPTPSAARKRSGRSITLSPAGAGWGGLPRTAAYYRWERRENDGKTPHAVTVKDVPVDAFWSITVYNADGYLEKNDLGRNSFNNSSAKPNEDGSFTIHFGGDPKERELSADHRGLELRDPHVPAAPRKSYGKGSRGRPWRTPNPISSANPKRLMGAPNVLVIMLDDAVIPMLHPSEVS
jgi:hypothetical protein